MYRTNLPRSKRIKVIEIILLTCLLVTLTLMQTASVNEKIEIKKSKLPVLSNHSLYDFYANLPRPYCADYSLYVLSPYDDNYLQSYVNWSVNDIIKFVKKNISYCDDGDYEYPKYPVETLIDGCGDCEDKAILCAQLLYLKGLNVSLIRYATHMNVLLNNTVIEPTSSQVYKLEDAEDIYPVEHKSIIVDDWNAQVYRNLLYYWLELNVFVYNYGSAIAPSVEIVVNTSNTFHNTTVSVDAFSCTKVNFVFEVPFRYVDIKVDVIEK